MPSNIWAKDVIVLRSHQNEFYQTWTYEDIERMNTGTSFYCKTDLFSRSFNVAVSVSSSFLWWYELQISWYEVLCLCWLHASALNQNSAYLNNDTLEKGSLRQHSEFREFVLLINQFVPNANFLHPIKHKRPYGFLMLSRGRLRVHWEYWVHFQYFKLEKCSYVVYLFISVKI